MCRYGQSAATTSLALNWDSFEQWIRKDCGKFNGFLCLKHNNTWLNYIKFGQTFKNKNQNIILTVHTLTILNMLSLSPYTTNIKLVWIFIFSLENDVMATSKHCVQVNFFRWFLIHERSERVRHRVEHEKRNFIYPHAHALFFI